MNELKTHNSSIGQLIEPERIGYSFNTPGWFLVFGLVLVCLLIYLFFRWRKYIKDAYRREATTSIEKIFLSPQQQGIFQTNETLKKICIKLYGRRQVASLYGEEWFEFLDSTTKAKVTHDYDFELFTKAIYQQDDSINNKLILDFKEFALGWVKNHQRNV